MKEQYSEINLGECGVSDTPHSIEMELIYSFKNSNLADAIYLLTEKGYTYQNELKDVLMISNSRGIINSLKRRGIIEDFEPSKEQIETLSIIKSMNMNNMIYMTTYRLTNNAKVLLQNPYTYKLLCYNANLKLKLYVEYLNNTYEKNLKQIEDKKQEEQEKLYLRYKIAKQKKEKFRTADDWAFIGMFENNY